MIDFETGYMPDVKQSETPESNDLYLYLINTESFYTRQMMPTIANLARKVAKGNYQPHLGLKAFENLADMGACCYNQEFGKGRTMRGFTKADRKACAVELMDFCRDAVESKVQELEKPRERPHNKQKSR